MLLPWYGHRIHGTAIVSTLPTEQATRMKPNTHLSDSQVQFIADLVSSFIKIFLPSRPLYKPFALLPCVYDHDVIDKTKASLT